MHLYTKLVATLLMLAALASCSPDYTRKVSDDLWSVWEKSERLAQVDFPDAVPIILIHGWNGGEHTWPKPERLIALEQQLGRDIYMFNYRTGIFANRYPPLEVLEEQLDRYMAPYIKVDVVAHSMGGLLLRQYLAHHNEHPVRRALFLATPHFGTNVAQVLVQLGSVTPEGNIQATEIQPGSDFLWQLNQLAGSELDGVESLNLYVAGDSLLKGDLVVSTASAYLPWAPNGVSGGDHHDLPKRIDHNRIAIDFLQEGTLPEAAPVPEQRDLWLRFRVDGKVAELSTVNFKAFSERGIPSKNYDLCCQLRSGLYATGNRVTVIIDKLQPGNYYAFLPYGGREPQLIRADEMLKQTQPVSLIEYDLDAQLHKAEEAAPVTEAENPVEADESEPSQLDTPIP